MRKNIQETQWRVTLIGGGTPKPIDQNVEAPSQDVAISRAMKAFPGQQFTQVTATALNPPTDQMGGQAQPGQQAQPQGLPAQPRGLQPMRGLATPAQFLQAKQQQTMGQQPAQESVNPSAIHYPYSITLPAHFKRVLSNTSPVTILESNGQYRIILETQEQMKDFVHKLKRHRDTNTVEVIMSGIRSSIS